MKHNYHSHTTWCNHASWTVETLIKKAIEHNFNTFGISEHIYSAYGINHWSLRTKENLHEYIKQVSESKKIHEGQIKVLCGLELEICDPFLGDVPHEFVNEVLKTPGVDYAIAGYHFYADGTDVYTVKPTPEHLEEIIKNTELFFSKTPVKYLAHPSGFVEGNKGWEEWMTPYVERLVDVCVKHDVVMGLNINGIYKERFYPCQEVQEIAARKGAKVILELDAHSAGPFAEKYILAAKDMADKAGVKLLEEIW